jgi:hypothetical protein
LIGLVLQPCSLASNLPAVAGQAAAVVESEPFAVQQEFLESVQKLHTLQHGPSDDPAASLLPPALKVAGRWFAAGALLAKAWLGADELSPDQAVLVARLGDLEQAVACGALAPTTLTPQPSTIEALFMSRLHGAVTARVLSAVQDQATRVQEAYTRALASASAAAAAGTAQPRPAAEAATAQPRPTASVAATEEAQLSQDLQAGRLPLPGARGVGVALAWTLIQ